ncbi:hypothetical protein C8R46DRAFT_1222566 [Mycena filopes]|nr:hypothetical protein C8R46DRAFT_1222566 [Mycena filopes]
MSERTRRDATDARPGKIIIETTQKRRSKAEIDKDAREKEEAKAEREKKAAKKKTTSMRHVAAEQDRLRKQDEQARATAARPDLHTAQLKRPAESQEEFAASPPSDTDITMDDVPLPLDDEPPRDGDFSDPSDDSDADYVEPKSPNTASRASDSGNEDDDSEDDLDAQLAKIQKARRERDAKNSTKKSKPKKGAMRAEIQRQQEVPEKSAQAPAKRKSTGDTGAEVSSKKPKATEGGLVDSWQKVVGVDKLPKKSATSWNRSRSSRASSTTSGAPGGASSGDDFTAGEFDRDEAEESLAAARTAKGASRTGPRAATAKMGIVLKKATVVLNVDGKRERESKRKRTYTNTDLPFPADGFNTDLKHFQAHFIPEVIDSASDYVSEHRDWIQRNPRTDILLPKDYHSTWVSSRLDSNQCRAPADIGDDRPLLR